MLFQRVQRSDPETIYQIVYNISGSSAVITAGYPCVWSIASTIDGLAVTKPASATLSLLVGIAVTDIANSAYGKIQCYGYKASAYVTNATNQAIAAGDILIPVNGQWYLTYSSAGDGETGFIMAAEAFATNATPGAVNKKVFIRCL
jgi:hypothetical protein